MANQASRLLISPVSRERDGAGCKGAFLGHAWEGGTLLHSLYTDHEVTQLHLDAKEAEKY